MVKRDKKITLEMSKEAFDRFARVAASTEVDFETAVKRALMLYEKWSAFSEEEILLEKRDGSLHYVGWGGPERVALVTAERM